MSPDRFFGNLKTAPTIEALIHDAQRSLGMDHAKTHERAITGWACVKYGLLSLATATITPPHNLDQATGKVYDTYCRVYGENEANKLLVSVFGEYLTARALFQLGQTVTMPNPVEDIILGIDLFSSADAQNYCVQVKSFPGEPNASLSQVFCPTRPADREKAQAVLGLNDAYQYKFCQISSGNRTLPGAIPLFVGINITQSQHPSWGKNTLSSLSTNLRPFLSPFPQQSKDNI